jgi:hypothetical protein
MSIFVLTVLLGGLAVAPGHLAITTGQCNGRDLTVRMTNTGTEPIYADTTLAAPAALHLPRTLISTWLPPGYTHDVPVAVTGNRPGTYHVRVSSRGRTIAVPVTVTEPPASADLPRLASRVTASSARAGGSACAAIDGKLATVWSDTTGRQWPDWWRIDWESPHRVSRVQVTTTATWGLRDWDVQVGVPGGWTTVASVRGNTAVRRTSVFPPRRTRSLRIVTLAGNTVDDHSRVAEVVIR